MENQKCLFRRNPKWSKENRNKFFITSLKTYNIMKIRKILIWLWLFYTIIYLFFHLLFWLHLELQRIPAFLQEYIFLVFDIESAFFYCHLFLELCQNVLILLICHYFISAIIINFCYFTDKRIFPVLRHFEVGTWEIKFWWKRGV